MALKQIEQIVNDEIIDEQDILKLFESAKGAYVFLPKIGGDIRVTVIGPTGRKQIEEIKMICREYTFDSIKLKSEKFTISAEKA